MKNILEETKENIKARIEGLYDNSNKNSDANLKLHSQ